MGFSVDNRLFFLFLAAGMGHVTINGSRDDRAESIKSTARLLRHMQKGMGWSVDHIVETSGSFGQMMQRSASAGVAFGTTLAVTDEFSKNVVRVVRTLGLGIRGVKRGVARWYHGSEGLTWNRLVGWNNRLYRLVTPIMHTTRAEYVADQTRDDLWRHVMAGIEQEARFIAEQLETHVAPYIKKEYSFNSWLHLICPRALLTKPVGRCIEAIRSATADERKNAEILFYARQISVDLEEIASLCGRAQAEHTLDTSLLRVLIVRVSNVFEHLGFLVDEKHATAQQSSTMLPLLRVAGLSGETIANTYDAYRPSAGDRERYYRY